MTLGPIEKLENGNFILESKIVELNQNKKKKKQMDQTLCVHADPWN